MFTLFILLLSFSEFLAREANVSDQTKCLLLNDEPRMVRPTLINMNPVELEYYPFATSLNKCSGSCNALSPKICAPKETKDMNVKAFNIITNKYQAKVMKEHFMWLYMQI